MVKLLHCGGFEGRAKFPRPVGALGSFLSLCSLSGHCLRKWLSIYGRFNCPDKAGFSPLSIYDDMHKMEIRVKNGFGLKTKWANVINAMQQGLPSSALMCLNVAGRPPPWLCPVGPALTQDHSLPGKERKEQASACRQLRRWLQA